MKISNITVIVNGKKLLITAVDDEADLTYDNIVDLAEGHHGSIYSVICSVKPNAVKCVLPGNTITVNDGAIINCMITGSA